MNASENLTNIIPALIKAQAEISNAILDSNNPHFKSQYASLESVLEAVKPALNKNDLLLIQPIVMGTDDKPYIKTTLLHKSGEYISSTTPVIFEKHSAQAAGSGYTYARRYSLLALVAIGSEDDDGNAAEGNKPKPPSRPLVTPKNTSVPKTENPKPTASFTTAGDFVIKFGDDKGKTLAELGAEKVSKKMKSIKESKKSDFKDSALAKEFFHWATQYLRKNPVNELDAALDGNIPAPGDIAPDYNDFLNSPMPNWDDER